MIRTWKMGNIHDWNYEPDEFEEKARKAGYRFKGTGMWKHEYIKDIKNNHTLSLMIDKETGEMTGVMRG